MSQLYQNGLERVFWQKPLRKYPKLERTHDASTDNMANEDEVFYLSQ